MRSVIISVLAVVGTAFAAESVSEYPDGQPQAYSTSSVAAVSSAAPYTSSAIVTSVSVAPYPVPGGNSTYAATGTAVGTAATATAKSTYASGSAPAPSAPAATGAASAVQLGLSGAALAGILAFVL